MRINYDSTWSQDLGMLVVFRVSKTVPKITYLPDDYRPRVNSSGSHGRLMISAVLNDYRPETSESWCIYDLPHDFYRQRRTLDVLNPKFATRRIPISQKHCSIKIHIENRIFASKEENSSGSTVKGAGTRFRWMLKNYGLFEKPFC